MENNIKLRERNSFDENWKFNKDEDYDQNNESINDANCRILNLPHDWGIEGEFLEENPAGGDGAYLPAGIGWYRKHFNIPETFKNKKQILEFDGVYMNSEVWINGTYLGKHAYGYTSFYHDLTPYLNYGSKENIIKVKVDNSKQPNSRWYTGSGIYRHTWLTSTNKLHVDSLGTFVTTPEVSNDSALLKIKVIVMNENKISNMTLLTTTILDGNNKVVACLKSEHNINENTTHEFTQDIIVDKPNLWCLKTPYLYKMLSQVSCDDKIVDNYETTFGIRKIDFDVNMGFLLNDQKIKLNGVCLHHDGGCVGAAVPERILERRLKILKEMGCNAIRMSHNPPSTEMLDMCDKMGFLVMDEVFDEWGISKQKSGKSDFGYYENFLENSKNDLISMLHRDRNHPSIVMWSVGNEIPEQKVSWGPEILKTLVDICHIEDPSRLVTSACDNIIAQPEETTKEFLSGLDIVGYNYVGRWGSRTENYYDDDRHKYPNRKMYGSENPSIAGVRGEYNFKVLKNDWRGGLYNTRMISSEQLWKFTKMHNYVAGDFMWTGVDYLGEARWPDKNSSCGVIDMCGFPKDGYYFYQSQWTVSPMLHLFPHWNFENSENKVIPVLCYTNCDSVELFLNGVSFGTKSYEFPRQGMSKYYGHFENDMIYATTSDLHLSWDIPYQAGTLKAIGMRGSVIVCEEEITTSGDAAKMVLMPDTTKITADGKDVCSIAVKIIDKSGNFVPTADNLIKFYIEGEGKIIGVDNGKPDSHESFRINSRKVFNGLGLVVIQSTLNHGNIRITAESEGIETISVVIKSSLVEVG